MSREHDFTIALWGTVDVARNHDYTPNYFIQMLDELGGVETAKRLLAKHEVQEGLMKLWELKLLPHSMEAIVLDEKYQSLFTKEELTEAHRRLEELDYFR